MPVNEITRVIENTIGINVAILVIRQIIILQNNDKTGVK